MHPRQIDRPQRHKERQQVASMLASPKQVGEDEECKQVDYFLQLLSSDKEFSDRLDHEKGTWYREQSCLRRKRRAIEFRCR